MYYGVKVYKVGDEMMLSSTELTSHGGEGGVRGAVFIKGHRNSVVCRKTEA